MVVVVLGGGEVGGGVLWREMRLQALLSSKRWGEREAEGERGRATEG